MDIDMSTADVGGGVSLSLLIFRGCLLRLISLSDKCRV